MLLPKKDRRNDLYIALFIFSAQFLLNGCSLSIGYSPTSESQTEVVASTDDEAPETTPFAVDILSEINDGSNLIVMGKVRPKIQFDSSKAVVRLSALDEQGIAREAKVVLKDLLPPEQQKKSQYLVNPGEVLNFSLQISSAEISNYQMEVRWGDEAREFLKADPEKQFVALRNLEIERIKNTNCDEVSCKKNIRLHGEIYNAGTEKVSKVVLGVGFINKHLGLELDKNAQIPQNERQVEIRNISLEPGSAKQFRLAMTEPETENPLTDFGEVIEEPSPLHPSVRILSFETSTPK